MGTDVAALIAALAATGFQSPCDLDGLAVTEAQSIIPPLKACALGFVEKLLEHCHNFTRRQRSREADVPRESYRKQEGQVETAPPKAGGCAASPAADARARAGALALQLLCSARGAQIIPAPRDLAAAITALGRLDAFPGSVATDRPMVEAKRARLTGASSAEYEQHAMWVEFAGWRKSAPQYASAVRLWGEAAAAAGRECWPPPPAVLHVFIRFFRNGSSLQRYVSHIRSVCRWLQIPLGALEDTERLMRGAEKLTPASARRAKVRATGVETRRLHEWTKAAGYPVLVESWVVARHFCFRYGRTYGDGVAGSR